MSAVSSGTSGTQDAEMSKSLFGQRMHDARERSGLTNRQVAEAMAVSRHGSREWVTEIESLERNLRRWQRGKNMPGGDTVIEFARIVGVSPTYFHTGTSSILEPLMWVVDQLVDKRIEEQAQRLRELVRDLEPDIADDGDPVDTLRQAVGYVHGRALVAKAECEAGRFEAATEQLMLASERLSLTIAAVRDGQVAA